MSAVRFQCRENYVCDCKGDTSRRTAFRHYNDSLEKSKYMKRGNVRMVILPPLQIRSTNITDALFQDRLDSNSKEFKANSVIHERGTEMPIIEPTYSGTPVLNTNISSIGSFLNENDIGNGSNTNSDYDGNISSIDGNKDIKLTFMADNVQKVCNTPPKQSRLISPPASQEDHEHHSSNHLFNEHDDISQRVSTETLQLINGMYRLKSLPLNFILSYNSII
ncbi:MAG: hypothetical protein AAGC47_08520 [Bacteroidota bacterium]